VLHPRRVTDRIDCYALYIDPPLGRVGMTEPQVRPSGRPESFESRIALRESDRVQGM
jgi:pyruvate/2-oxoglutarate dehydrogenase complex dihydrolipoamide dehydrogenase (E3) component